MQKHWYSYDYMINMIIIMGKSIHIVVWVEVVLVAVIIIIICFVVTFISALYLIAYTLQDKKKIHKRISPGTFWEC